MNLTSNTTPRVTLEFSGDKAIIFYRFCLQASKGKSHQEILDYSNLVWSRCGKSIKMNYEAFMFQFVSSAKNEFHIIDLGALKRELLASHK